MWRKLTVGNWNVLEEGSATLVGPLPLGQGTAVSQVSGVTSVTGWRQTAAEPSAASYSKSKKQRPNNTFIHSFHILTGDKVPLKVKRGCSYQDRQAQVSHRSQKLVPAAITVIRAGPHPGRASVLRGALWAGRFCVWSPVSGSLATGDAIV